MLKPIWKKIKEVSKFLFIGGSMYPSCLFLFLIYLAERIVLLERFFSFWIEKNIFDNRRKFGDLTIYPIWDFSLYYRNKNAWFPKAGFCVDLEFYPLTLIDAADFTITKDPASGEILKSMKGYVIHGNQKTFEMFFKKLGPTVYVNNQGEKLRCDHIDPFQIFKNFK